MKWILLFDWDGTLINSLEVKISNAAQLMGQQLGLPAEQVAAAYRRHSGIPRRELFDAICADCGAPPLDNEQYTALSRAFTEMNQAALCDQNATGVVSAETRQALCALKEQGYALYISSSADVREVLSVARLLGLSENFREILGSKPGFGKGKDHVAYVLGMEQAPREQVVFVGDEAADIRLAHEAGVIAVAKAGTLSPERLREEKPDHIIASIGELLHLFKPEPV